MLACDSTLKHVAPPEHNATSVERRIDGRRAGAATAALSAAVAHSIKGSRRSDSPRPSGEAAVSAFGENRLDLLLRRPDSPD